MTLTFVFRPKKKKKHVILDGFSTVTFYGSGTPSWFTSLSPQEVSIRTTALLEKGIEHHCDNYDQTYEYTSATCVIQLAKTYILGNTV